MEPCRQEESKSSSEEEIDQPDKSSDENGIGRSYECVFCKRGFTTAQALGGHMNIHRKERAKPKPPSNRSLEDYYAIPGIYLSSLPDYPKNYNPIAYEPQINFSPINIPSLPQGARSTISPDLADGSIVQFPQSFDTYFKEEINYGGLSLHLGPASAEETQAKRQRCGEGDEVDLELRLGHDP